MGNIVYKFYLVCILCSVYSKIIQACFVSVAFNLLVLQRDIYITFDFTKGAVTDPAAHLYLYR